MELRTQLVVVLVVFCVMMSWLTRDVDAQLYRPYDTSRPGVPPCSRTSYRFGTQTRVRYIHHLSYILFSSKTILCNILADDHCKTDFSFLLKIRSIL